MRSYFFPFKRFVVAMSKTISIIVVKFITCVNSLERPGLYKKNNNNKPNPSKYLSRAAWATIKINGDHLKTNFNWQRTYSDTLKFYYCVTRYAIRCAKKKQTINNRLFLLHYNFNCKYIFIRYDRVWYIFFVLPLHESQGAGMVRRGLGEAGSRIEADGEARIRAGVVRTSTSSRGSITVRGNRPSLRRSYRPGAVLIFTSDGRRARRTSHRLSSSVWENLNWIDGQGYCGRCWIPMYI